MTTARTWQDAFLHEPARIAIGQPHQVFLSGVSITFTAAFFYDALGKLPFLHPWLATLIAVAGAVGAEYAYLKGLADGARAGGRSRWQIGLIATVCALLVISGVVVSLKYAYPLPALVDPSENIAVLLTLAHIVPLAMLGLCSAMLHAEVEAAVVAEAEARQRAAETEAAERRAHDEQRARRRAEALEQIELDKARKLADVEALEAATLARRRLREAASPSVTGEASAQRHEGVTPRQEAPGRSDRAMFKTAVIDAYRQDPAFGRAELARTHGWSRPAVNAMLDEARAEGLIA